MEIIEKKRGEHEGQLYRKLLHKNFVQGMVKGL
jgi:hypothetical protein